ncbi:MAG: nucleotidyltransferase family protein [Phycisphaerae bacterium]
MVKFATLPPKLMKKGLREKLLKICEGNDISFMAVFGSFIRGEENRRSDIDIAIEFSDKSHKDLFDLIHIEDELRKIFERKVDLGIFSAINPHIIEDVKKEMRVIYEKR